MRPVLLLAILSLLAAGFMPSAAAQELRDPNPAIDEWIESTLVIAQPDLTTLEITGQVTIRKYVVEGTAYRTSDDMGDAYQQSLQADEFARANGQESDRAETFVADVEANVRDALVSTLGASYQGAKVTVSPAVLDRATLVAPFGNPFEPGVRLDISARVERTAEQAGLGELNVDALDVVFDAGARIGTTATFTSSPGHDVTYVLEPPTVPKGVRYLDVDRPELAAVDGDLLVVRVDNSAGAQSREESVKARLWRPEARVYSEDEIQAGSKVAATVDLQDIDISIGKVVGGDMGSLVGAVTVSTDLGVFAVTDDLKKNLPENVELDTLTSNTLRLLLKHGAVDQSQVAQLESAFLEQASENLRNALQVPLEIEGGLVDGTMDATGVTGIHDGAPIRLSATASFVKPLSPGGEPAMGAATTLYALPMSFPLPSVQGLSTTYKVILPPGLAVSDFSATGGQGSTGTENGRDYFTVAPESGQDAQASMSIGITPGFVIAKFWPVLLLAVLIIFLLVGTPIALVVLRRRKKNEQDEE